MKHFHTSLKEYRNWKRNYPNASLIYNLTEEKYEIALFSEDRIKKSFKDCEFITSQVI